MAIFATRNLRLTMISHRNPKLLLQTFLVTLCLFCSGSCAETDTITRGQTLKDSHSIISRGKVFKLGFFTPANTRNRYLAISYKVSEKTLIWIANRDNPLRDFSGVVSISKHGNIVLSNGRNQTFWSTNISNSPMNTSAELLDTGNLVLRDNSTGHVVWESFRHPSHVFLPTMQIIHNIVTNYKVAVTSWKNATDPGVGMFMAGLQAVTLPQAVIWNGSKVHWRSGPWNGQILIGVPDMYTTYLDRFSIVSDNTSTYYFTAPLGKFLMKFAVNSSGFLIQTIWNDQARKWDITWYAPQNECDLYAKCGPFGSCNMLDSPICSCLKGFEPKNKDEWESGNWTGGCVRRKPLQCDVTNNGTKEDGFLRMPFMKVPEDAQGFRAGQQLDQCRTLCSSNCSCIAYAFDAGIGCMFWSDTLIDTQQLNGVGVDLYIRLASSEIRKHKDKKWIIAASVVLGTVSLFICLSIIRWKIANPKAAKRQDKKLYAAAQTYRDSAEMVLKDGTETVNLDEFPPFTFEEIANATNQFHRHNLLGKGGFGPVYKGKLANGKEVAVKRLSAASGQGAEEFMNEVKVISKVQHRNLVRLLGCCVEREEKMLVYEYMPNGSLDVFLFDQTNPSEKILDWETRFNIIEGVGRGLLYLHRDSRLKIIHRDLKPSNVLLDEEWGPKISDFGMARIFGGNEDHVSTGRVVGTYGYMSPEYAMEGRFSEKSDVYSFGVLMLEVTSGKRNTQYYNHEMSLSLLGFAWKIWNENNSSAFIDPTILSPENLEDIMRCIHIALLCVQEFPVRRPNLSALLLMLSGEIVELPAPEQPVFAEKWNRFHFGSSQQSQGGDVTLTTIVGR